MTTKIFVLCLLLSLKIVQISSYSTATPNLPTYLTIDEKRQLVYPYDIHIDSKSTNFSLQQPENANVTAQTVTIVPSYVKVSFQKEAACSDLETDDIVVSLFCSCFRASGSNHLARCPSGFDATAGVWIQQDTSASDDWCAFGYTHDLTYRFCLDPSKAYNYTQYKLTDKLVPQAQILMLFDDKLQDIKEMWDYVAFTTSYPEFNTPSNNFRLVKREDDYYVCSRELFNEPGEHSYKKACYIQDWDWLSTDDFSDVSIKSRHGSFPVKINVKDCSNNKASSSYTNLVKLDIEDCRPIDTAKLSDNCTKNFAREDNLYPDDITTCVEIYNEGENLDVYFKVHTLEGKAYLPIKAETAAITIKCPIECSGTRAPGNKVLVTASAPNGCVLTINQYINTFTNSLKDYEVNNVTEFQLTTFSIESKDSSCYFELDPVRSVASQLNSSTQINGTGQTDAAEALEIKNACDAKRWGYWETPSSWWCRHKEEVYKYLIYSGIAILGGVGIDLVIYAHFQQELELAARSPVTWIILAVPIVIPVLFVLSGQFWVGPFLLIVEVAAYVYTIIRRRREESLAAKIAKESEDKGQNLELQDMNEDGKTNVTIHVNNEEIEKKKNSQRRLVEAGYLKSESPPLRSVSKSSPNSRNQRSTSQSYIMPETEYGDSPSFSIHDQSMLGSENWEKAIRLERIKTLLKNLDPSSVRFLPDEIINFLFKA